MKFLRRFIFDDHHDLLRGPVPCDLCDGIIAEHYCGRCGLKKEKYRVGLRRIANDLLKYFNFERGFLTTFMKLVADPSKVLHQYRGGLTVPYTNPVKYAIIAVALQYLLIYLYPEMNFTDFPFFNDRIKQVFVFAMLLSMPPIVYLIHRITPNSGDKVSATIFWLYLLGTTIFIDVVMAFLMVLIGMEPNVIQEINYFSLPVFVRLVRAYFATNWFKSLLYTLLLMIIYALSFFLVAYVLIVCKIGFKAIFIPS